MDEAVILWLSSVCSWLSENGCWGWRPLVQDTVFMVEREWLLRLETTCTGYRVCLWLSKNSCWGWRWLVQDTVFLVEREWLLRLETTCTGYSVCLWLSENGCWGWRPLVQDTVLIYGWVRMAVEAGDHLYRILPVPEDLFPCWSQPSGPCVWQIQNSSAPSSSSVRWLLPSWLQRHQPLGSSDHSYWAASLWVPRTIATELPASRFLRP